MKKIILPILLILCANTYSQTLTIAPNNSFDQCPNQPLQYTVNNSVTNACIFDWTVTNGSIQGGSQNGNISTFSGGTLVTITWNNTTSSGQVSVVARNCSPSGGNISSTPAFSYAIRSINGVNPGSITGASTVTVNTTTNQVYSIAQINFPNIGTAEIAPKEVNSYEWEIPAGWAVAGGGSTKSITVTPDNCSGGNIRVRGKSTTCTNGPYYSNWSNVATIVRTIATPSVITGPASINCSDVSTKTYSISAVGGATSFTWTLPSGWTGTSTTTSITVTPNGLNAGTIAVRANGCSLQSAASSLPIAINLSNPANPLSVSGPQFVCNSGGSTFTLNNTLPNSTATWSTASPTYYVGSSSGSGFSATLQTTATVAAQTSITFNVSTPCGSPPPVTMSFWAGVPGVPTTNPSGVPAVQARLNSVTTVRMASAPGATLSSVNWTVSDLTALSIFSIGGSLVDIEALKTGTYFLFARTSNICGTGSYQRIPFRVTSSGGGGPLRVSAFPNPSTDEVTLELDDSIGSQGEAANVKVLDKYQGVVFETSTQEKTIKIPVQNLSQGIYYLTVNGSKGSYTQRIRVDH